MATGFLPDEFYRDAINYRLSNNFTGGSGITGFLNPIVQGLAAAVTAPQGTPGILPGIAAGMNAWNQQRYINAETQRRAQLQQAEQDRRASLDSNNATMFNNAVGGNYQGPIDTKFAGTLAPLMMRANANPTYQSMANNPDAPISISPNAIIDPAVFGRISDQMAASANYNNAMNQMTPTAQAGQRASLSGGGSLPQQPQTVNTPGGDMTLEPLPLQAGVQQSGGFLRGGNIFNQPTDIPAQLRQLYTTGMTDAQKRATLDETIRSNKADESIDNRRLDAQIAGDYYRNDPPVGRAPTALEMMSPEQQATFLENYANSGGKPTTLTGTMVEQLNDLAKVYNDNQPSQGGWFGIGANSGKEGARAAAMYNAVAKRQGLPLLDTAPFKGKGGKGLKEAEASLAGRYK